MPTETGDRTATHKEFNEVLVRFVFVKITEPLEAGWDASFVHCVVFSGNKPAFECLL